MLSHTEPGETYPEPTRMPGYVRGHRDDPTQAGWEMIARAEEWRLDADGTRYRAIVVRAPQSGRVLVAVDPDGKMGRSWWVFDWAPGNVLSDEYIAEKWRLRDGDDTRNMARLIRAALHRP